MLCQKSKAFGYYVLKNVRGSMCDKDKTRNRQSYSKVIKTNCKLQVNSPRKKKQIHFGVWIIAIINNCFYSIRVEPRNEHCNERKIQLKINKNDYLYRNTAHRLYIFTRLVDLHWLGCFFLLSIQFFFVRNMLFQICWVKCERDKTWIGCRTSGRKTEWQINRLL